MSAIGARKLKHKQRNLSAYLKFAAFLLWYFDAQSLQVTPHDKSNIVFKIDRG